jgi:glycosyltransferase involved in cell wall biosynthesis
MKQSNDIEISVCTIYRNEEKNLELFLERHAHLFQEFILIDTGSTDKSNDILKSHHIPYYFYQWDDSFSNARNYSLKLANKPYILVIDIDEYITEADLKQLKTLVQTSGKDVYSLKQINFSNALHEAHWKSIQNLPAEFQSIAAGYIPSPLFRFFKNHPGIYFSGKVHELIGESVSLLNLSSLVTNIPIYHYGWVNSCRTQTEIENKKKKYNALVEKEWQTNPTPRTTFHYLKTLQNAKDKIRISLAMTKECPEIKEFWEILAENTIELQQWPRAFTYLEKGLHYHPHNSYLQLMKTRTLIKLSQPDMAFSIIEKLIADDPQNPVFIMEKYRILLLLKQYPKAEDLKKKFPQLFPGK